MREEAIIVRNGSDAKMHRLGKDNCYKLTSSGAMVFTNFKVILLKHFIFITPRNIILLKFSVLQYIAQSVVTTRLTSLILVPIHLLFS